MATVHLTADGFKEKIFDYSKEEAWNYKGELPAIVDFYADWCGPCKAVAPVLEELSKEYEGRLVIYKIDTDKEEELSSLFGIQSIPTTVLLGRDGDVYSKMIGFNPDDFAGLLTSRIQDALSEASATAAK